jgi:hypothetical protein
MVFPISVLLRLNLLIKGKEAGRRMNHDGAQRKGDRSFFPVFLGGSCLETEVSKQL